MADFNTPQSRTEAILENILGADNELTPPQSRVEAILQNMLGATYEIGEPQSRIEDLLIQVLEQGGGSPDLVDLNATQNGTYNHSGHDGYDEVVVNVPNPSTGNLNITDMQQKDVSSYATAQVVDADLVAENIKNGVEILGVQGTYAGGGTDYLALLLNGLSTFDYTSDEVVSIPGSKFSSTTIRDLTLPNCNYPSSYAFSQCNQLRNVVLDKCWKISNTAFYSCPQFVLLDIGLTASITGVTYQIEASAFYNCSRLASVCLRRTDGIYALQNTNAFQGTPIASGTGYIYVPSALLSTYQGATNWSTYSAQFRALENYTVDGTISGDLDPTKI